MAVVNTPFKTSRWYYFYGLSFVKIRSEFFVHLLWFLQERGCRTPAFKCNIDIKLTTCGCCSYLLAVTKKVLFVSDIAVDDINGRFAWLDIGNFVKKLEVNIVKVLIFESKYRYDDGYALTRFLLKQQQLLWRGESLEWLRLTMAFQYQKDFEILQVMILKSHIYSTVWQLSF